ncbi:MAG: choice-of-anchor tandem repeat NxxGxxAF-containing protein [Phycisphaerales bacterium]
MSHTATRPLSCCLIALACGIALGAGSIGAADTIHCLALTGGQAPGMPANVRFADIEPATIGAGGAMTFRATLEQGAGGVDASNDTGIWIVRDLGQGAAALVAREGSPAPGMPLGVTYAQIGAPGISTSGQEVAYWARLSHAGGIDDLNDRVIYRYEGGAAQPYFQTGSISFGTPQGMIAELDGFQQTPAVGLSGYPAMRGALVTSPGGVPADEALGIWTNDLNNDVVQIARAGGAAADTSGAVYDGGFSTPLVTAAGDLVYTARLRQGIGGVDASSDEGIWVRLAPNEANYLVAREGDLVGYGSVASARFDVIYPPVVSAEPRVGFRALMRPGVGGVNSTNDEALFSRCPCGALFAEARESWPAFGRIAGAALDSFSDPVFSRDGRMCFAARVRGAGIAPSNDTTIWWSDLPIQFLVMAREGDPAPGAGGVTFAEFDFRAADFWLATTDRNHLVFPATLSTGARGVWVFTPGRGVRALVKEGDSVQVSPGDTRQIVSITPRTEGYQHNGRRTNVSPDGNFIFLARLSGGATALLAVPLPVGQLGCPSDWNNDQFINSQDFFDFLVDLFDSAADINYSGTTDSQDFFDFLTAFFSGC